MDGLPVRLEWKKVRLQWYNQGLRGCIYTCIYIYIGTYIIIIIHLYITRGHAGGGGVEGRCVVQYNPNYWA